MSNNPLLDVMINIQDSLERISSIVTFTPPLEEALERMMEDSSRIVKGLEDEKHTSYTSVKAGKPTTSYNNKY